MALPLLSFLRACVASSISASAIPPEVRVRVRVRVGVGRGSEGEGWGLGLASAIPPEVMRLSTKYASSSRCAWGRG